MTRIIIPPYLFQEHQLIVGIVVIADPGTVPINSRQVLVQRIKKEPIKDNLKNAKITWESSKITW